MVLVVSRISQYFFCSRFLDKIPAKRTKREFAADSVMSTNRVRYALLSILFLVGYFTFIFSSPAKNCIYVPGYIFLIVGIDSTNGNSIEIGKPLEESARSRRHQPFYSSFL